MNAKNGLFCLLLSVLSSVPGIVRLRQEGGPKHERMPIKGRIVGYSIRSSLRPVHGKVIGPPHDAFLFLVGPGDGKLETGEYIKLQYTAAPGDRTELPPALFEESNWRTFTVERDKTCDESTASFARGEDRRGEGREVGDAKRFPNLIRLRGVENVPAPEEAILRCYSLDRDGIEK
jgi:hypothetical protein